MPQINLLNFVDGANTAVSPFLIKPTELRVLNGANVSYILGAMLKDTGYKIVDAQIQANKSVRGLFHFRQNSSTEKMLATIDDATSDDTQLFYKTEAGTWTEITTAETAWANFATMNVEMESFIEYCFFVGHGTTDGFLPVLSLTGTTTSTSTNITNMPKAKFIKRYRDRLYVANCQITATNYPYRVYYSSVPSAGAITWTQATDFFDVDYSDEITGLGSAFDRLLVFTDINTYFYDQAQRKQVFSIGCSNNRTIQGHISYLLFANADGVWMTTGGQPSNVSGKIGNFLKGSNHKNWFATLVDEEYHLYVGTVTHDGVTYTNTLCTYNIPTNTWRWRELGSALTILGRFNSASNGVRMYMGDSAGYVWEKTKYSDSTITNSDEYVSAGSTGKDISVTVEFAPMAFDAYHLQKDIGALVAYSDRAQNVQIKARVLDRNSRALTPYLPIGTLTKYINPMQVSVNSGEILQLALVESSKNPYFSFYGFSLNVEKESDSYHIKNKH